MTHPLYQLVPLAGLAPCPPQRPLPLPFGQMDMSPQQSHAMQVPWCQAVSSLTSETQAQHVRLNVSVNQRQQLGGILHLHKREEIIRPTWLWVKTRMPWLTYLQGQATW